MKRWLHEILVCPNCLPKSVPMDLSIRDLEKDDILNGLLSCPNCGAQYGIRDGVAVVIPKANDEMVTSQIGYNSRGMLSAYLWSHFCDLLNDADATDAYNRWTDLIDGSHGLALDIGCAVGRLSFEMSATHQRVIGIDTAFSFIQKARRLLQNRGLDFDLIVEGTITEKRACQLPDHWNYDRVEFIVADAMALPFGPALFSTVSSINILEKVPNPIHHLKEVNRVLSTENARFAFSDPFSWDESVSPPELWLGGRSEGRFSGRGIDVMQKIFSGIDDIIHPPLKVMDKGSVSWKIRKTQNLWESITSQYLVGDR